MRLVSGTHWLVVLWIPFLAWSVITGAAHQTQYHPLIAASFIGVAWFVVRYYVPGPCRAIDYVVLCMCVVLGAGSYSGITHVVVTQDIVGIVCVVAGLIALSVSIVWTARNRMPHTSITNT